MGPRERGGSQNFENEYQRAKCCVFLCDQTWVAKGQGTANSAAKFSGSLLSSSLLMAQVLKFIGRASNLAGKTKLERC